MNINYLSDDEETTQVDPNVNNKNNKYDGYNGYDNYVNYDENNQEEMNEEELQEYINCRMMILEKTKNKSYDSLYSATSANENKIEKNNNLQKKKTMSFSDFNAYADKIIEESKPKKFVSKRIQDKKNQSLETDTCIKDKEPEKVITRKFNPRLPPYFSVHKKNIY